jgi:alpha-tubulin suppressor-like RCC1 family protein
VFVTASGSAWGLGENSDGRVGTGPGGDAVVAAPRPISIPLEKKIVKVSCGG